MQCARAPREIFRLGCHDGLIPAFNAILSLHSEMKEDQLFKSLCEKHGLPWDSAAGYEPRGYNGPPPENVRLLVLMAEPGAITQTEAQNLRPAISHDAWTKGFDLNYQEHYWRKNLQKLCHYVWPESTEDNMYEYLGKSNTFWMSLRPGSQTSPIRREPLDYFERKYLTRFLTLFPNAVILAAGGKAQERLRRVDAEFESCSAFTKPESNKPRALDSWCLAGHEIGRKIAQRWA
jgi:hypothetical protein